MATLPELDAVFRRLKDVLSTHDGPLSVSDDTSTKYCLESAIGPATLKAWGGRVRRPSIPVAWVEVGKAYVSYHLMGITVPTVQNGMSKALKARMQGKTCFNFKTVDEALFEELRRVTAESLRSLKRAGFIADMPVPDR